jgi:pyridoxine/pyridoxamine 5'-phosphate oxidase
MTPPVRTVPADDRSEAETVTAALVIEQHDRTLAAMPTASQVRAWARSQGLEVPDRGRLSSEIWSAYQREHAYAG